MILGFVLLAIAGLMLWRGFTGQSPLAEVQRLVSGEPIFVRDQTLSIAEERETR